LRGHGNARGGKGLQIAPGSGDGHFEFIGQFRGGDPGRACIISRVATSRSARMAPVWQEVCSRCERISRDRRLVQGEIAGVGATTTGRRY